MQFGMTFGMMSIVASQVLLSSSSTDPFGDSSLIYKLEMQNATATVGTSPTNNGVTFTTDGSGKFGEAGIFNGTTAYMVLPSGLESTTALSVSLWAKFDTLTGELALVDLADTTYYKLWIIADNLKYFTYDTVLKEIAHATSNLDTTNWFHIVTTLGSGEMKLYINGTQVESTVSVGTLAAGGQSTRHIGADNNTLRFFDGKIDQFEVYNRALTADEVSTLYTQTDGPSGSFNTVLYTGNGSTQTINTTNITSGVDFVWIKSRSNAVSHAMYDSIRGATKSLRTNDTTIEQTYADALTAFGTSSVTLGADTSSNQVNLNTATYVAWCASLPNDGSYTTENGATIASTTKSNSFMSAFSYTGNGTIGAIVNNGIDNTSGTLTLIKGRTNAFNWAAVSNELTDATYYLYLNSTAGQSNAGTSMISAYGNGTLTLTDSVNTNANGVTYIGYTFKSVAGKCKVGSYTGAVSLSIDVGFEPAFVLIKKTSDVGQWCLFDNQRGMTTGNDPVLFANLSDADYTLADYLDSSSTGWTFNSSDGNTNATNANYIYLAIARGA